MSKIKSYIHPYNKIFNRVLRRDLPMNGFSVYSLNNMLWSEYIGKNIYGLKVHRIESYIHLYNKNFNRVLRRDSPIGLKSSRPLKSVTEIARV